MVEIATSHKTLLAMTDLDRYFHPHLVLQSSMRVYPGNNGMIFITSVFIATNHNLILDFHPHPHLLPSREKEL
jgi:hypothetical protein